MELEFVTNIIEGDKIYQLYYDQVNDIFYKIFDDEKIELTGEELIAAKAARRLSLEITEDKKYNEKKELRRVKSAKRLKKEKFKKRIILSLLVISLFGGLGYEVCKNEIEYVMTDQNSYNDYNYLIESINSNSHLTNSKCLELEPYLKVLASLDIDKTRMASIGFRLAYHHYDGMEVFYILEDALDLGENAFVAKELYYYVNDIEPTGKHVLISNLFSNYRDTARRLVNGESVEKLIKEYHGENITVEIVNNRELKEIKDLNTLIAADYGFVNSSDGYKLNNNIFEEYTRIKNGEYNIYGKPTSNGLEDVTREAYYKKLNDLISKTSEVDYSNQDYRFLVYLYANAIINNASGEDITSYLFSGVESDMAFLSAISYRDLYTYLDNSNNFSYDYLILLADLAYMGEDVLPLLQEVNLCLRYEVEAGNLESFYYETFFDFASSELKSIDEELYNKFIDATLYNKSIDGFKLEFVNKYETL